MPRMSAADRRTEIVEVALGHFARGGFRGTSTEAIAADTGVSQPYLFRLFGTKRDLFLACCDACHEAILGAFTEAAEAAPEGEKFTAMGGAYRELLENRRLLLFQMQQYAASGDPVVRAAVRERYLELFAAVQRLTGAPDDEVWNFFGKGMLLNVVASLDLPDHALPPR